uniref:DUF4806 domain-containing protein n=1 Tax=Anopheles epiroticus TaxID=199890 RepID=A0A182PN81_9DIPT
MANKIKNSQLGTIRKLPESKLDDEDVQTLLEDGDNFEVESISVSELMMNCDDDDPISVPNDSGSMAEVLKVLRTMSKQFGQLNSRMDGIQQEIQNLSIRVLRVDKKLKMTYDVVKLVKDVVTNSEVPDDDLDLPAFQFQPLTNEDELKELDARLGSDREYYTNLINWMSRRIFKEDPSHRLDEAMDLVFEREFLIQCSWLGRGKSSGKKIPMRENTHLLQLFREIGCNRFVVINDAYVERHFKKKLPHARDRAKQVGYQKKKSIPGAIPRAHLSTDADFIHSALRGKNCWNIMAQRHDKRTGQLYKIQKRIEKKFDEEFEKEQRLLAQARRKKETPKAPTTEPVLICVVEKPAVQLPNVSLEDVLKLLITVSGQVAELNHLIDTVLKEVQELSNRLLQVEKKLTKAFIEIERLKNGVMVTDVSKPVKPAFYSIRYRPVTSEEQLTELNNRLGRDAAYFKTLTEWLMSRIVIEDASNRLHDAMELLFDRAFLVKCSWKGRGRSQPKIPLGQQKNILKVFIAVGSNQFLKISEAYVAQFFKKKLPHARAWLARKGGRRPRRVRPDIEPAAYCLFNLETTLARRRHFLL